MQEWPAGARPLLSALEPARRAHLCSRALQTPPPSNTNNTLAEFYRFALLLTGSIRTAELVMAETLAEVAFQLSQVRSETGRQAWFVQRIREHCLKNNESSPPVAPPPDLTDDVPGEGPRVPKIEAFPLAQRFHALPEPERSALALFYLDFFTIPEIAELLKMSAETLAETLAAGRALLAQSLRTAAHDDSTHR